jgi:hypothetical protein
MVDELVRDHLVIDGHWCDLEVTVGPQSSPTWSGDARDLQLNAVRPDAPSRSCSASSGSPNKRYEGTIISQSTGELRT